MEEMNALPLVSAPCSSTEIKHTSYSEVQILLMQA